MFPEEGDRVVTSTLLPPQPLSLPGSLPRHPSPALADSEVITSLRVCFFLLQKVCSQIPVIHHAGFLEVCDPGCRWVGADSWWAVSSACSNADSSHGAWEEVTPLPVLAHPV